MPGIVELAILALLVLGGMAAGTWYLIRLATRAVRAREDLLRLERERTRAPDDP